MSRTIFLQQQSWEQDHLTPLSSVSVVHDEDVLEHGEPLFCVLVRDINGASWKLVRRRSPTRS